MRFSQGTQRRKNSVIQKNPNQKFYDSLREIPINVKSSSPFQDDAINLPTIKAGRSPSQGELPSSSPLDRVVTTSQSSQLRLITKLDIEQQLNKPEQRDLAQKVQEMIQRTYKINQNYDSGSKQAKSTVTNRSSLHDSPSLPTSQAQQYRFKGIYNVRSNYPCLYSKFMQDRGDSEPFVPSQMDDGFSLLKGNTQRQLSIPNELNNQNLYIQAQKKELNKLNDYVDDMLEKLVQPEPGNEREFYYKIESQYTGVVMELQRQVETHFKDQGQLLQKLWFSYASQIRTLIEKTYQTALTFESDGLQEASRLHSMYQKTIREQQEWMRTIEAQKKETDKKCARLETENIYLRRKDLKRDILLRHYRLDLDVSGAKISELQNELQTSKYLLQVAQNEKKAAAKSDQSQLQKQHEEELFRQRMELLEYFRNNFEKQKKELEEAYQQKNRREEDDNQGDDRIYDFNTELQKEASTYTGDYFTQQTTGVDTSTLYTLSSRETQTIPKSKTANAEVQAEPMVEDLAVQADIKIIRRDAKTTKKKDKKSLLAQESVKNFVAQYDTIPFPLKMLQNNDSKFLKEIHIVISLLQQRGKDIFNLLQIKDEILAEDLVDAGEYFRQTYGEFTNHFDLVWGQVQRLFSNFVDVKIERQEAIVENERLLEKLEFNIVLYKKLYAKFKEQKDRISFLDGALQQIIRYAPQYQINSIKDQAQKLGFLQSLKDFTKIDVRKSVDNFSPQRKVSHANSMVRLPSQLIKPVSTEKIQIPGMQVLSLNMITEVESPAKIKRNPTDSPESKGRQTLEDQEDLEGHESMASEEQSDDGNRSDTSDRSNLSLRNLKYELKVVKPILTLEQKFRIQNCPLKFASSCTSLLNSILKRVSNNDVRGIMKLSTLLEVFNEFFIWLTKLEKFTPCTPFHVFLYDYLQNQFSASIVANKFRRIIKSTIYYVDKSQKCRLFSQFLKAELDYSEFALYMKLIHDTQTDLLQEPPEVDYKTFSDSISKYLTNQGFGNSIIKKFKEDLIVQIVNNRGVNIISLQSSKQNFDILAQDLFTCYQQLKELALDKYRDIFASLDVDKNEYVKWEQLELMAMAADEPKLTKMVFYKEADLITEDRQRLMTLPRLAVVCEELKIFAPEKIQKILQNQNQKMSVTQMKEMWFDDLVQIKISFLKANHYSPFIKGLFGSIEHYFRHYQESGIKKSSFLQVQIMILLLKRTYKPIYLSSISEQIGISQGLTLISRAYHQLRDRELYK